MKVLIVASNNVHKSYAPFIVEQVDALCKEGCTIDFFCVVGKGVSGYLRAYKNLRRKIQSFQPDVIHAHYGLCGLLANLQRRVPVVTTYHGSDINVPKVLKFSKLSIKLSAWNIFVSQKNVTIAGAKKKYSLIPCGIDLEKCEVCDMQQARERMGLNQDKKYVLFAGAFDNAVKNPELALGAMRRLSEVELLELKGYTREQVTLLMCAVDAFLMTSYTEGSPQVIKEAMACGCPIISVDVGDVAEVVANVDGCYIVGRTENEVAEGIQKAIGYGKRTEGRKKIIERGLSNGIVADKIINIYSKILSN